MLLRLAAALAAGLVLLAGCGEPAGPEIRHANARVRALVPGQDKTVAYVDLTNTGSQPVTLIAAHSREARSIEFHETRAEGNMLRMRRMDSVVIDAQETVRLAPGGLHLMLFGVKTLPSSIDVEFSRADGPSFSIPFRRVAISTP